MSEMCIQLLPGPFLHDAIMGALKGKGVSFTQWCDENSVHRQTVRQCTYGMSGGQASAKLLEKLISDAGRENVETLYRTRHEIHVKSMTGDAA